MRALHIPILQTMLVLAIGMSASHGEVVVQMPPSPAPPVAKFNTCAKPVWPRASLRNEETGTVTLSFLIDVDGKVAESKIVKSSGFPLLDMAAREGIERCMFKPGMVNGKPGKAWMQMQYVWTLDGPAQPSPQEWQAARDSAARGEAGGEYELAMMYLNGPDARKDRPEAQRLLSLAASKDHAQAQVVLGMQLLNDKDGGDLARAAALFASAAEKGVASAQYMLGAMHMRGNGVPRDVEKGLVWLRKAHIGADPHATTMLGSILVGRAANPDELAEGISMLRKTSAELDPQANFILGKVYETGRGVSRDHSQAAVYYRKAAAAKHRQALLSLANLYEHGKGVPADTAEADKLRAQAASSR